MISDKMKILVNGSSAIRAMFEEGKRLATIHGKENVYDFSLGNPNVLPPDAIKKAVNDVLDDYAPSYIHGYMNNSGYEEARAAIAGRYARDYGVQLAERNIIMTCGAAGGINITFKSILNPGDEVIAFAPFFSEYGNYTANFDAKLVVVPTQPESFDIDLTRFEAAITDKTRAVIINSPNNPSGVVYPDDTLRALAGVLEAAGQRYGKPIFLISDEPYRELVYDDIKLPFIPSIYRNTFIIYSWSKTLSIPGERIGYVAVSDDMDGLDEVLPALNVANRILGFVNAPSLFQLVAARCLDESVDISVYKKNRDYLYDNLTAMGIQMNRPQGAFYLFPKAPGGDDIAFCNAAKEERILIVPGTGFGCKGYFRLAYCVDFATIENSMDGFRRLAARFVK